MKSAREEAPQLKPPCSVTCFQKYMVFIQPACGARALRAQGMLLTDRSVPSQWGGGRRVNLFFFYENGCKGVSPKKLPLLGNGFFFGVVQVGKL